VYVYHRNGTAWTESAKLTAADGKAGDSFGLHIAADGGYLVVSAGEATVPGAGNAGAAYVFQLQGASWTQQAKLMASDEQGDDGFASDVGISGSHIIVGADWATANNYLNSGAAYIFGLTDQGWVQQSRLYGTYVAPVDQNQFGYSVAISGQYAIVGAIRADTIPDSGGYTDCGAAYIFEQDGPGWSQVTRLEPTVSPNYHQFGKDVAITDGYAMVSSMADVAYIYAQDGAAWVDKAHIVPDDFPDSNEASVAISPDCAVLGHRYEGTGEVPSRGAVYTFTPQPNGSWAQQYKFMASDAAANDARERYVRVNFLEPLCADRQPRHGVRQFVQQRRNRLHGRRYYDCP
jgi:hypothetical protein